MGHSNVEDVGRSFLYQQGSHYDIRDIMDELKRRASDQIPSHLIYVYPRDETGLTDILKPEMSTFVCSACGNHWTRQK